MKILRIFNNNIILVKNEETDKESILWGKGVGFQKSKGENIEINKGDSLFVKESESEWVRSFISLSDEIPLSYFELTKEIVKKAENKLNVKFNPFLLISLTDHIYFAVQRSNENNNIALKDIKEAYPKEYNQAIVSKLMIEREFNIKLNDSEIGFLTIHFIENEYQKKDDKNDNRIILDQEDQAIIRIKQIISRELRIDLNNRKINSRRLTTHLRFLIDRIQKKEHFSDSDEDKILYFEMAKLYPKLKNCIAVIIEYLNKKFGYKLTNSEKLYLIMHLQQITKQIV
ncbi:PRD domain-containing protein [Lactobacillus sp. ESL0791]|uniref:PRD domain-containing protein n=1 Tax=Lactobacillus sp. ESL0791 TaxID=2983234 RepID=UPI0023F8F8FC|nr:PRD domain-containing protein [Lactobacillus sp. ESL0791]MDF7638041.1 PRD domain-containing protein [Lactobacillus sp. ESL0791]